VPEDHRRFSRLPFECEARLLSAQGPGLVAHVHDVSLKGMLIELDTPEAPLSDLAVGSLQTVDVLLEGMGEPIEMRVVIRRVDGLRLAAEWVEMPVESLMHLRRLLELNLGDAERVEREVEFLGQGGGEGADE